FRAEPQYGQNLDARPCVTVGFQQLNEASKEPAVIVVARLRYSENGQKAVREQLPDAVQNALKRAGTAQGIVLGRREAVHGDAELQTVGRCVLCGVESFQPWVLEYGPVREHGRRAVTERQLQDRRHVRMQKRFAAREVVFLDANGE